MIPSRLQYLVPELQAVMGSWTMRPPLSLGLVPERRGGEGAAPKWPHVKCNSCDAIAKWKKMRSVKVWGALPGVHDGPGRFLRVGLH
eukprot:4459240-Pyramimonas_sp.AAC.1